MPVTLVWVVWLSSVSMQAAASPPPAPPPAAAPAVPAAQAVPESPGAASPADDPAAPPPVPAHKGPFDLKSATLSGDWLGARPALKEAGITFNLFYNHQHFSVLKGGLNTNGSGRGSGSIDALLTFDLGKMGWLEETDLLIHGQRNWGRGVNPFTGAIGEVNDDADGDLSLHIAQLWVRRHWLQRRVSLMVGFLDYQTIVDRNAFANSEDKQFMHQSLDNNPLVPLNIGLGAALTVKPVEWYTLIVGAGDAHSKLYKPGFSTAFHDDSRFFAYVENAFSTRLASPRGPLPGNARLGAIYDPRSKAVFVRPRDRAEIDEHDTGLYVSCDQLVYRESAGDEQGLGVFGRYGYRNPERNRMSTFWSAGLSYTGLVPGRDKDVLGLGFSLQRSSHVYRRRVLDTLDNETVYELYYAINLTDWFVVTPDIQYVDNPGAAEGDPSHAIVAGVRVRISF